MLDYSLYESSYCKNVQAGEGGFAMNKSGRAANL